eukprot:364615-Chlamydomonas_euryale.AAC.35
MRALRQHACALTCWDPCASPPPWPCPPVAACASSPRLPAGRRLRRHRSMTPRVDSPAPGPRRWSRPACRVGGRARIGCGKEGAVGRRSPGTAWRVMPVTGARRSCTLRRLGRALLPHDTHHACLTGKRSAFCAV